MRELMLIMSVTVDDCAPTSLETGINCFMAELKKRLKISSGGLLKKYIRVDCKQGI